MIDEYVRKWLLKATNDLKVAENELKVPSEDMVTEAICFHSQQAVEKYLKAYLITRGIEFGKTHNLEFLLELCIKKDHGFQEIDVGNLSFYAVEARYPDEFYIPSLDETEEYVEIARRVREFVLGKLGIKKEYLPFVKISCNSSFSKEQIQELKSIFPDFEVETFQWAQRAGAIDVLTVLEIAFGFALAEYFAGFLSEAGKKTWELIAKKFRQFVEKNNNGKEIIAFVFYIGDIPIYLVDRFHESKKLEISIIEIPFVLMKVEKFLNTNGIPDDVMLMQVFQDPCSRKWKYLFMPTPNAFGSFVDRVLDLDSFQMDCPQNHQEFIEKYCGNCVREGYCLICAKFHLQRLSR